jgi:multiple sugar transport system permease protein
MKRKIQANRIAIHTVLISGALVMLYPILWLISSSFKPNSDIFTSTGLIPNQITLENYTSGWVGAGTPFGVFLLNSFIICALAVVGNVAACSMAAYVFARLKFWGSPALFAIMRTR